MASKSSQRYWAERRAREMKQELDPIEDTALELSRYYQKASEEIEAEAMKLARRFQNRHGLSEREAWRLLAKRIPPDDLDAVIEELKKDPKNRDLVAQLESQAYAARINQLREAQAAADSVVASIYRQAQPIMAEALEEITRRSYYENLFGIQQQAGFGWGVPPLDPERVRRIVDQPWTGKSFSSRLWSNTGQLAERVKEQIVVGILTGKTPHKMAQAIEGEFHAGARNARRLIRTEASYAANEIQRQTYEDLGVERYIYVAILDLRTSEICRSLDMKRFPVAEARVGDPLHPYPPMHPYCRSTTIADLGDEWLSDMKKIALDPATGKVVEVPMTMTYQEWYEKFVSGAIKQSGGRETFAERYERREAEAAEAYEEIRRDNRDIELIAASSGMPTEEIIKIKNHVFFDEHALYNGYGRLDPDYDMAVAWERLKAGVPEERDVLLLRHELLETNLEKAYDLDLGEAHAIANERYDWQAYIEKDLGEEGEPDGLLQTLRKRNNGGAV